MQITYFRLLFIINNDVFKIARRSLSQQIETLSKRTWMFQVSTSRATLFQYNILLSLVIKIIILMIKMFIISCVSNIQRTYLHLFLSFCNLPNIYASHSTYINLQNEQWAYWVHFSSALFPHRPFLRELCLVARFSINLLSGPSSL